MFKRCLTMILLLSLMTNSVHGGEVIHVPKGWSALTEGYFMDRQTAEEVGTALSERRLKMWTFEAAHQDLKAELVPKLDDLEAQLKAVADQLNNERKANNVKINNLETKIKTQKLWNIALPVLAIGAGIAIGKASD